MHQKLVVLSCSLPHASHGFAQYSFTVCDILRGLAYLARFLFNEFRTFFPQSYLVSLTHITFFNVHTHISYNFRNRQFSRRKYQKRDCFHISPLSRCTQWHHNHLHFFFTRPLPPSTDQKAPALRIITFPSEHVSKWQRAEEKLMLCLNLKRINAELG